MAVCSATILKTGRSVLVTKNRTIMDRLGILLVVPLRFGILLRRRFPSWLHFFFCYIFVSLLPSACSAVNNPFVGARIISALVACVSFSLDS